MPELSDYGRVVIEQLKDGHSNVYVCADVRNGKPKGVVAKYTDLLEVVVESSVALSSVTKDISCSTGVQLVVGNLASGRVTIRDVSESTFD